MTEQERYFAQALTESSCRIDMRPNEDALELFINDQRAGVFNNSTLALKEVTRLQRLPLKKVRQLEAAFLKVTPSDEPFEVSQFNLRRPDWNFLQPYLSPMNDPKAVHTGLLNDPEQLRSLVNNVDPYQHASLYLLLEAAFAEGKTSLLFTSLAPVVYEHELGDFSQPNPNENCLHHLRCPACGDTNKFSIMTRHMVVWEDDGSDDGTGHSAFDSDSACQCETCFHRSKVAAFEEPEGDEWDAD